VNEETAVGEVNIDRHTTRSIPRNPTNTAIGIIIAGTMTSLPRTPKKSAVLLLLTFENWKKLERTGFN